MRINWYGKGSEMRKDRVEGVLRSVIAELDGLRLEMGESKGERFIREELGNRLEELGRQSHCQMQPLRRRSHCWMQPLARRRLIARCLSRCLRL